jgi:hypothetical protein
LRGQHQRNGGGKDKAHLVTPAKICLFLRDFPASRKAKNINYVGLEDEEKNISKINRLSRYGRIFFFEKKKQKTFEN